MKEMVEDRLVVLRAEIKCASYSGDLLGSSGFVKELEGRPKFSIKDHTPIKLELRFVVKKAARLVLSTRGYKYSEGVTSSPVIHSYEESMGYFEASSQEKSYAVREFLPSSSNPMPRATVMKVVMKITDSAGNDLFAVDFFFSFKLSLLTTFLGHENDSSIRKEGSSRDASLETARTATTDSSLEMAQTQPATSTATHWSKVEKQQLPADPSKKIMSLIENDVSKSDSDSERNDRRSTGDVVKELGFWLYSTNVGQYFLKFNDEKARLGDVKEVFNTTPINMLGVCYQFSNTDDEGPSKSADDSSSKKTVRAPMLGSDKRKAHSADELLKKQKVKRTKSIPLPKKPRSSIPTIERCGSLGDAYSIREVRKFPALFSFDNIVHITNWLSEQKFHVKWFNEFNIDAEEDGKTSLVKNSVFIRFYSDIDAEKKETNIDFNIFAAYKKTSLSFYLSSSTGEIEGRAAKMLWVLGQLVEYMESLTRKSEIIFSEGFNADVISHPRLVDLMNEKDDDVAKDEDVSGPVEGELMLFDEKNRSGWVNANVRLEDDIFTVKRAHRSTENEEGSSIPIKMAAVKMTMADNTIDIHFNGMSYHLRAKNEEDFLRWSHPMRSASGFLESDIPERPAVSGDGDDFSDYHEVALPSESEQIETRDEDDLVILSKEPAKEEVDVDPSHQETLVNFLRDFQSRMWLTYRKDFPKIEPSSFSSDVGWGCMLRTAQMLLAQGLVNSLLNREWRIHQKQTDETLAIYRHILLWFADDNNPDSYYSLHNMAKTGRKLDKKIGEWFGPCTAAYVLRRLSVAHKGCPVTFYVNQDQAIYCDLLQEQALFDGVWRPVLVLLPVRLGVDTLNPIYHKSLKKLFEIPQFLGIAGGKPCKSLYFIASQDDELFYLDPHIVRPYCPVQKECMFPVESYHCDTVRKVQLNQLDPSMLLGFLIKSRNDLTDFVRQVESMGAGAKEKIFHVHNTSPDYVKSSYWDELASVGLGRNLKH